MEKVVTRQNRMEMIVGMLPVMVRSDLCHMKGVTGGDCDFDQGGYFIIKGAEKVILLFCFSILINLSTDDHCCTLLNPITNSACRLISYYFHL